MCIAGLNARCKDDATAVVSARFVRYVPRVEHRVCILISNFEKIVCNY